MNQLTAYRARFVVPITRPPISDGMVVVNREQILAVGRFSEVSREFSGLNPVDLGDVAILPGMINAHTHLEFSDLPTPLGTPGIRLTDWIALVMKHRATDLDITKHRIESGLVELARCSTAAVGEISTANYVPTPNFDEQLIRENRFSNSPPHIVSFFELIGSSSQRIESAKSHAQSHRNLEHSPVGSGQSWYAALSPHAPYSCHTDLLRWACDQAAQHHFPVAMHLAESPDELQLLREQTGPFREMLESIGVWNPAAFKHPCSPLEYLKVLATADRSLVIHGNYLSKEEMQFAAAHHESMSIVFCPRTHAFFQHERYPLETMLDAGVTIALGTDSRASNPDLSVWREAKFVAKHFPNIRPEKILEMVTINGANSLGLDHVGSLEVGKVGTLKVVECGDVPAERLLESLLNEV